MESDGEYWEWTYEYYSLVSKISWLSAFFDLLGRLVWANLITVYEMTDLLIESHSIMYSISTSPFTASHSTISVGSFSRCSTISWSLERFAVGSAKPYKCPLSSTSSMAAMATDASGTTVGRQWRSTVFTVGSRWFSMFSVCLPLPYLGISCIFYRNVCVSDLSDKWNDAWYLASYVPIFPKLHFRYRMFEVNKKWWEHGSELVMHMSCQQLRSIPKAVQKDSENVENPHGDLETSKTSGEIYDSGFVGVVANYRGRFGPSRIRWAKSKNILENPGEHDIQEHHKGIMTLKKKDLTWFHMHGSSSAWGKISCFEKLHPAQLVERFIAVIRSHVATGDDFMFTFQHLQIWYTEQKTKNMSSKKGQWKNRIYIWTNHWFSVDMLVFDGLTMILIVISCTTMKLRFSVNKSLNFPNLREACMHPLDFDKACWASIPSKFARTDFRTQFPGDESFERSNCEKSESEYRKEGDFFSGKG